MGYSTWKSLKAPLQGRMNIIITHNHINEFNDDPNNHIMAVNNIHDAVKIASCNDNLFIIGGESIYREYLRWYTPDKIYLTKICRKLSYTCDRVFPMELLNPNEWSWNILHMNDDLTFTEGFYTNTQEIEYLKLFNKVIDLGSTRMDRTGTGTTSIFGERLEFSLLNNTLPLLTTKKMGIKTIARELLWFISGSTDTKILETQGVNIWKGNTSRKFLDNLGLSHY